jgi:RHS repeat-associated protein
MVNNNGYQYKYNGKEWQDELGLEWYDYGARNYDPAIGRWMNVDPLAEMYPDISPYVYSGNTPTVFVDYDGQHFGIEIDHNSKKITITGHFYANKKDMKLLDEIATFLNEQTGNVLKVGEGEDAVAYNIGFKITTEESSDPKESAKKANLKDNEGGNNNAFKQDSIDSMFKGTERGAASAYRAAIKDDQGLFTGVHEALHLLGSGHKDGIMKDGATDGGLTPSIYGAILSRVGIGDGSVGSGNVNTLGVGRIRSESGTRPAGFISGTVISRAKFDRQIQRAMKNRLKQEKRK